MLLIIAYGLFQDGISIKFSLFSGGFTGQCDRKVILKTYGLLWYIVPASISIVTVKGSSKLTI